MHLINLHFPTCKHPSHTRTKSIITEIRAYEEHMQSGFTNALIFCVRAPTATDGPLLIPSMYDWKTNFKLETFFWTLVKDLDGVIKIHIHLILLY